MQPFDFNILKAAFEDTNKRHGSFFRPAESIVTPPWVAPEWMPVDQLPRHYHVYLRSEQGQTPVLRYPLPEGWDVPMSSTAVPDAGLIQAGWTRRGDSKDLFNDFLRLAKPDIDLRTEEGLHTVAAFAQKWGPLWLCRTALHGPHCYWWPEIWLGGDPKDTTEIRPEWAPYQKKFPCHWRPLEEAGAFVQRAKEVKALFEAILRVQSGDTVPETLWRAMGINIEGEGIEDLASQFQTFLVWHLQARLWQREPYVTLGWGNGPQLKMVLHMGFIHVVHLILAQELCQATNLYQCKKCGSAYIRTGNTPARGTRTYCDPCRYGKIKPEKDTQRASKTLSAQRRRLLQRTARNLFAEGLTCEEISQQLNPNAGKIKIDPETVQKWVSPRI